MLRIVFDVLRTLNFCVKRNHNQSSPRAVVRCTDLRKMIGIEHQSVRGFKVERCFEFLFGKNRVSGTKLFDYAGIQSHNFLQFCRNNHSFTLKFRHFRLDITFAIDSQCICWNVTTVTSKDFIYYIPECWFSVSSVTICNNHRFHIHLAHNAKSANHLHIVN